MHFEEVLDQAIAMLQRRGRVTYRALKRQFNLDDAFLEDLTVELIKGQRLARDEDGEVLVWTGAAAHPRRQLPRLWRTPRPTWSRRSSPPEALWQASANRSPCCSPTLKAPPSSSATSTQRPPSNFSIPPFSA